MILNSTCMALKIGIYVHFLYFHPDDTHLLLMTTSNMFHTLRGFLFFCDPLSRYTFVSIVTWVLFWQEVVGSVSYVHSPPCFCPIYSSGVARGVTYIHGLKHVKLLQPSPVTCVSYHCVESGAFKLTLMPTVYFWLPRYTFAYISTAHCSVKISSVPVKGVTRCRALNSFAQRGLENAVLTL